jgi:hypothetical protein
LRSDTARPSCIAICSARSRFWRASVSSRTASTFWPSAVVWSIFTVSSGWSSSTVWPSLTCTAVTVPARGTKIFATPAVGAR